MKGRCIYLSRGRQRKSAGGIAKVTVLREVTGRLGQSYTWKHTCERVHACTACEVIY